MDKKKSFVISGVFCVLTVILIVLVKCFDVSVVEATGTPIGFSNLNNAIHDFFGINIIWYSLTEVFGVLALIVCAAFAFVGLMQLIRRKSLTKVDPTILKLGGLYVVVIALYVLFEKVIINYRPIIMPDASEAEASFPSSHTMLICVVMGSTIMVIERYIRDEKMARIIQMVCCLIMLITVVGRLICGVHWFTDILGGVFISMALLSLFKGLLEE